MNLKFAPCGMAESFMNSSVDGVWVCLKIGYPKIVWHIWLIIISPIELPCGQYTPFSDSRVGRKSVDQAKQLCWVTWWHEHVKSIEELDITERLSCKAKIYRQTFAAECSRDFHARWTFGRSSGMRLLALKPASYAWEWAKLGHILWIDTKKYRTVWKLNVWKPKPQLVAGATSTRSLRRDGSGRCSAHFFLNDMRIKFQCLYIKRKEGLTRCFF